MEQIGIIKNDYLIVTFVIFIIAYVTISQCKYNLK